MRYLCVQIASISIPMPNWKQLVHCIEKQKAKRTHRQKTSHSVRRYSSKSISCLPQTRELLSAEIMQSYEYSYLLSLACVGEINKNSKYTSQWEVIAVSELVIQFNSWRNSEIPWQLVKGRCVSRKFNASVALIKQSTKLKQQILGKLPKYRTLCQQLRGHKRLPLCYEPSDSLNM